MSKASRSLGKIFNPKWKEIILNHKTIKKFGGCSYLVLIFFFFFYFKTTLSFV